MIIIACVRGVKGVEEVRGPKMSIASCPAERAFCIVLARDSRV